MDIFNNSIIDVILSMLLIYALLSILVSVLIEWWNHWRKARGIMLKESIMHMLHDPFNLEYGALFFNHHMIGGIRSYETKRPPQYISSSMFAEVLIDIIAQQVVSEVDLERVNSQEGKKVFKPTNKGSSVGFESTMVLFKKALNEKMAESPFRDMLCSFESKSDGKYENLKILLEKWYNDHQDRVSGWYKTKQKNKYLIAGFLVAIVLNIDSIFLIKVISMDDDLKNQLVRVAEGVADDYEKLNTDQKKDVTNQITLIRKTMENDLGSSKKDTSLLIDTNQVAKYLSKMEILVDKMDSVQQVRYNQANEIGNLVSDLSIPIGWKTNYAPISWFIGCDSIANYEPVKISKEMLESYIYRRNCEPSFIVVSLYVLGIFISGFLLSFGAPFWFDLLVKVVNVRRAGKKPIISPPAK